MAVIRLSPDVEALAQKVSDELGLGSIRVAVEAIVRKKALAYLNGSCDCAPAPAPNSPPKPAAAIDAAAALDEVM